MALLKAPPMVAIPLVAIVLGTSSYVATAAGLGLRTESGSGLGLSSALGVIKEVFTTNPMCSKNRCINPIFPGLEDLHRLQQSKWVCSTLADVQLTRSLGFCGNAITYDPAVPVPSGGGSTLKTVVMRQDDAANTMFHYHLAGLGIDAWDFPKPEFADDCIRSIWRSVCFTYFPRAEIGCKKGSSVDYLRPCKSVCENYVKACGVECCDESVACVFTHKRELKTKKSTQIITTEGYIPHDGPSSMCTGGARRSAAPFGVGFWALVTLQAVLSVDSNSILGGMRSLLRPGRRLFLFGALVAAALSLQGCTYDVPVHKVGNWRSEVDYLLGFRFIPPGGTARSRALNSCSMPRLSSTLQCSGRGTCKLWRNDDSGVGNNLAFCNCDVYWADPECRTKRKSQVSAYILALFFGFTGADQFYLGFPAIGFFKLFTGGGFGVLWVYDIIRIGSAPVYASDYRVAADLPHFAYVLTCSMFAILLGFAYAYRVTVQYRTQKRKEAMLLGLDEEARQKEAMSPFADAYGSTGMQRPVIQPGSQTGMGGMGGPYGSMGMAPMGSMGMGPMPPNMGPNMPMGSMGQMGPMPSMGRMGPMPSMGPMGPMGPVPSAGLPMR